MTQNLPPWVFMWLLAFGIYTFFKLLTWWQSRQLSPSIAVSFAYIFGWPGMDGKAFFDTSKKIEKPKGREWVSVTFKTSLGIALFWGVARCIPSYHPLLKGWIGMIGLIFILHFGIFHLLALFWQARGINTQPIFHAPALSTSLQEFWGESWNLGFRQLAHVLIFTPLRKRVHIHLAVLATFLVSGLLHDLVISIPAKGGYGLPTAYFIFQGLATLFENSKAGKILGLGVGLRGWFYVCVCTAGPAFWLFHPPFVTKVILPFMRVTGGL